MIILRSNLSVRSQLGRIASIDIVGKQRQSRLGPNEKCTVLDYSQGQTIGFDIRHQETSDQLAEFA